MKTEEHPEPTAVFLQRVTAAVSELKDHLQQDYERTYPALREIIRIVLDEEEAKAWEFIIFSPLVPARHHRRAHRQSQSAVSEDEAIQIASFNVNANHSIM